MRRPTALLFAVAVLGAGACGGNSQSHECIKAMDDVARHQLELEAAGQIPVDAPGAQVQCVIQPDGSRSYIDRAARDYVFYRWLDLSMSDPGYGGYRWMHAPERVLIYERVQAQAAPVRVREAPPRTPTTRPPARPQTTTPVTFEPPRPSTPPSVKAGPSTPPPAGTTPPVTFEPQVTGDGKPTVNPPTPATTVKPPAPPTTKVTAPPTTRSAPRVTAPPPTRSAPARAPSARPTRTNRTGT